MDRQHPRRVFEHESASGFGFSARITQSLGFVGRRRYGRTIALKVRENSLDSWRGEEEQSLGNWLLVLLLVVLV